MEFPNQQHPLSVDSIEQKLQRDKFRISDFIHTETKLSAFGMVHKGASDK